MKALILNYTLYYTSNLLTSLCDKIVISDQLKQKKMPHFHVISPRHSSILEQLSVVHFVNIFIRLIIYNFKPDKDSELLILQTDCFSNIIHYGQILKENLNQSWLTQK
jgi:hypothetical protein